MRAQRGASTVGYAVLLVAIVIVAAGSWKLLGSTLSKRSSAAGDTVSGDDSRSGSSRRSSSTSESLARGGDEKMSASSKVHVGGSTGEDSNGELSSGGHSGRAGTGGSDAPSRAPSDRGSSELGENITPKRWFAYGLLALSIFAFGYVAHSLRRARRAASDVAGGSDRSGSALSTKTNPLKKAPPDRR